MKPLVSVRQLFTWLCICTYDETSNEWKETARIPIAIGNFAVLASHFVVSYFFLKRFVEIDLPASLFALMCCCGDFSLLYILTTAFFLRHRVTEIFKKLSIIYNTCKYHHKFNRKVLVLATVLFSFRWKRTFERVFGQSQREQRMVVANLLQIYGNDIRECNIQCYLICNFLLANSWTFWCW